jgi:sulfoxide reductase catalytic subunit YedY
MATGDESAQGVSGGSGGTAIGADRPTAGAEKRIGRRAFIGLIVAGLAALFLGKELIPRIPGGVSRSLQGGDFRINSVSPGPEFDRATWRLTVDGLFRKPLTLTFDQFLDLPQVERTRDFYCVEGWGVSGVQWKGVTVRELMSTADIDPQATHLVFHSGDGIYTDSLTLEEALRPDTLLAHEMNGEQLGASMGQPLRLVLPGNYGYKYVKWVTRVEAIAAGTEGYKGYWEKRGYPADAEIG